MDRITIDPNRMRGLPCIRDTRVTVSAVLAQLAAGRTVEQVLAAYPYLEVEDVLAALAFAAEAVQQRQVLGRPAAPQRRKGSIDNMATNPDRDPIDEEIERVLAANPGLLEELQEYDRRAARGEDVGEFMSSDELRRRLGLPRRERPA